MSVKLNLYVGFDMGPDAFFSSPLLATVSALTPILGQGI